MCSASLASIERQVEELHAGVLHRKKLCLELRVEGTEKGRVDDLVPEVLHGSLESKGLLLCRGLLRYQKTHVLDRHGYC